MHCSPSCNNYLKRPFYNPQIYLQFVQTLTFVLTVPSYISLSMCQLLDLCKHSAVSCVIILVE